MNSDNKTDFQKFVEQSEKERALHKNERFNEYKAWNQEYRQNYWDKYIFSMYYHHEWDTFPIKIEEFREKHWELEPNFDVFIPWIMESLKDFWYTIEVEDIFTLDEKAKKTLELSNNISNNSYQVENTISTKTERIEWIDISNEELAEKIGDLFYDSLSSFMSSLWEKLDNTEISHLLQEASQHIMTAWEICLPYVSHDFPEMKHTTEIKWLDIDKEELAKRISNLVDSELKDFLGKLSAKIYKDGKADEWRNRIKLATQLYSCAEKLKWASEKIK